MRTSACKTARLTQELEDLQKEYDWVENYPSDYIEEYGRDKDSVLEDILSDIENVREELDPLLEKEIEDERTAFTVGFGISRFS
jgi:bacterioferritin (cytochrome b1)